MIVIGMALLGASWGGFLAKQRKGNTLDMLQYGTGFAIAFALLGLIITIIFHRSLV